MTLLTFVKLRLDRSPDCLHIATAMYHAMLRLSPESSTFRTENQGLMAALRDHIADCVGKDGETVQNHFEAIVDAERAAAPQ